MNYDLEWLISDYGNFLAKFGLEEGPLREHYAEWSLRSGRVSARDYLWYLFHVILGETARQVTSPDDREKNNLEIYTAMWFFRTHVEGQPAQDIQQLMNESRIRLWQLQLPYHFKVKVTGEACCVYCDGYHNKLLSPADLVAQKTFVAQLCTNPAGCTCTLAPLAERDEDNKILLKDAAAN